MVLLIATKAASTVPPTSAVYSPGATTANRKVRTPEALFSAFLVLLFFEVSFFFRLLSSEVQLPSSNLLSVSFEV